MKKLLPLIVLSTLLLSAGFWPNFSFAYTHGKGNVDKNFIRDGNKSVVVDTKTNKFYYDAKPSPKLDWNDAMQYCKNLHYLAIENWRVPTKEEMRSLLELSRRDVTVKHAFKYVKPAIYWSSTKDRNNKAWYFDFDLGRYWVDDMNKKFYVICITENKTPQNQKTLQR